ncbi:DUF4186 domain-containing protein [Microbacterium betulae]|uniref:DUF4186 domain-containing protein n=1 Tax=Microbacterium betulae TaxID=2981139 RepID=A0AA97FF37_9MICO|nr:DUF4186 domain-containing protein [Microbacterium sp. AB]WOF22481.1 DUF4186 domain-containing protein [Microbacterium sp. AB]
MDTSSAHVDEVLARVGQYPFRAKFHLRDGERRQALQHEMSVIRHHAADIVGKRLAPAHPAKDGKQTPWGGHPVFRAQHATGTCCRGCLKRLHGIRDGRELTGPERDYVVAIISRWIEKECARPHPAEVAPQRAVATRPDGRRRSDGPEQPTLF